MSSVPAPNADPGGALPPWAAALLAHSLPADPAADAAARARVMAAVRRLPRHGRPLARAYALRVAAPRWARRRGLLAPGGAALGGALLAALLAAGAGGRLGPAGGGPAGLALGATVLGDTVLGNAVLGNAVLGRGAFGRALGDTLGGALGATLGDAVRDTLRVVRFALAGPAARAATRVALAADFTGWRPAAPLVRAAGAGGAGTGAWTVTLAVPRDAVRYAFVVDGAAGRRWVPAPPLPAAGRAAGGAAAAGDST